MNRILIIDDDKEFCEELRDVLKDEGFDPEFCLSPEQGIGQLKQKAYAILLLDFKMPGMNGVEFLKKYEKDLGNLRIFMITGSLAINRLLAENGLSGLVKEVIGKPFDVQNLIQKLKDIP